MGLNRQAEEHLQQVYQQMQQQPDRDLHVAGLRNLGSVLRQLGDLDRSRVLLQESYSLATRPEAISLVLLELGNTEWAMGDRLIAIGQHTEAQLPLETALNYYQQAIAIDASLPAQLNRLDLLIQLGRHSDAMREVPTLHQAIAPLPPSRSTLYARIHLAASLMNLEPLDAGYPSPLPLLSSTIQDAQRLNDLRAESYALGQLGHLYEQTGQWTEAQSLTEQALLKIETIQAPEIRYRWEWQLGRLAQQQGQSDAALTAY